MFISDYAIKRPLITIVSMVALVVFGLFALWQLQTDEFPDVAEPVVFTAIIFPGASPDQVERELLDPIEEAIQGISGVDKIQSNSLDGYGVIRPWLPNALQRSLRRVEGLAIWVLLAAIFFIPGTSDDLFEAATGLCAWLGVPMQAVADGWFAFRFWDPA